MAIREILTTNDESEFLHKKSREVTEIDNRILTLLDDMAETMYDANGVGLAAPQVGILRRVVVIDVGDGLIELINPVIVYKKGEQIDAEGCLSVPGRSGTVARPEKVKVRALNRNGEEKSFSITRKAFEQRNVEYNIYDNLGYIRIYQFAENADEQFQQALNTLLSKNVDGIIFDVRNNPGGELNTVCSMIDMLIPGGEEIIVIEYKDEEEIIYSTNTRLADMPFVVLMNNSSASGSELFSSSLRDILGTKLIGENSFGKGVGQTTFPLNDGSGVKITTFKYLTKSRVDYNNTGLKPDYEVDLDSKWDLEFYTMTFEDDIQLQKAISVLTQEIG